MFIGSSPFSLNVFIAQKDRNSDALTFDENPTFQAKISPYSLSDRVKNYLDSTGYMSLTLKLHTRTMDPGDCLNNPRETYTGTIDGFPNDDLSVVLVREEDDAFALYKEYKIYHYIRQKLAKRSSIEPVTAELHAFACTDDKTNGFLILERWQPMPTLPRGLLEYELRLAVFRLGLRLHDLGVIHGDIMQFDIVLCGGRPRFRNFTEAVCSRKCRRATSEVPDDRSLVDKLKSTAFNPCFELSLLGGLAVISRDMAKGPLKSAISERMDHSDSVAVRANLPSPYGRTWEVEKAPAVIKTPQYYNPEAREWKPVPRDWGSHWEDYIFDYLYTEAPASSKERDSQIGGGKGY